ncbi:MAG: hypothetical protein CVU11_14065 [Bacteroidetes bacterium HGW-Bacteroidetes-6]|jgi:hypothetical protein|nr:MAG: hypothetical protein CVU11_14065 [Bacteroidetes bacterium HGW-Bacteroidetes-6]
MDEKDLIDKSTPRCSDDRCPINMFCERYLQNRIDWQKGEKSVSINDFMGREKIGLCDHFLNVDIK